MVWMSLRSSGSQTLILGIAHDGTESLEERREGDSIAQEAAHLPGKLLEIVLHRSLLACHEDASPAADELAYERSLAYPSSAIDRRELELPARIHPFKSPELFFPAYEHAESPRSKYIMKIINIQMLII